MYHDADTLKRIFGEADEQPEPQAFIRADGIDLALHRPLTCSSCGELVVELSFPARLRSHWRREMIEALEKWIRRRFEFCPACSAEWGPPPYGK